MRVHLTMTRKLYTTKNLNPFLSPQLTETIYDGPSLSAVYEVREIFVTRETFLGINIVHDYVSLSLLGGVQQQVHELVSGMGIGNEQGR